MAKVTVKEKKGRDSITVKTNGNPAKVQVRAYQWWEANSKQEKLDQLLSTFEFLKTQNN